MRLFKKKDQFKLKGLSGIIVLFVEARIRYHQAEYHGGDKDSAWKLMEAGIEKLTKMFGEYEEE